jgi:predicted O-methyltransferase YrrM
MPGKTNPWLNDEEFLSLAKQFHGYFNLEYDINSNTYARMHVLRQLAKLHNNASFGEAGIYAGMSMFFTAEYCNNTFIGIDSFRGVSEPNSMDSDYFKKHDLSIDKKYCEMTLARFNNIKIFDGWIPEILKDIPEKKYSFVNIDVDLYEPTKHSIEYFWERLLPGGVMILDDFGSSKTIGARKAALEILGKEYMLELDTGQCIVYKY